MKGAVIDDDGRPQSITNKVCGSDNNSWATEEEESSLNAMSKRCIRPSYTVYIHENNKIYRCIYKDFLDQEGVDYNSVSQITNNALNRCKNDSKKELIMPYVKSFSLQSEGPELLVNYTVYRQISSDVPPISFKFKKYFVRKRGV